MSLSVSKMLGFFFKYAPNNGVTTQTHSLRHILNILELFTFLIQVPPVITILFLGLFSRSSLQKMWVQTKVPSLDSWWAVLS